MEPPSNNSVILIVDDTPENVDVLAGVLREHYQIRVALNGPKALKIAQSDPAPALILLDVMMPEMDGYQVCLQLQADERTRRIPVIFVTAKSEVEDEAQGFGLGAVDYITKPVNPAIVLARVRTHLALKHSLRKLEDLSLKLARYLPQQVYQSIFEGRQDARIGCSRKKLTVFFPISLASSTRLKALSRRISHSFSMAISTEWPRWCRSMAALWTSLSETLCWFSSATQKPTALRKMPPLVFGWHWR